MYYGEDGESVNKSNKDSCYFEKFMNRMMRLLRLKLILKVIAYLIQDIRGPVQRVGHEGGEEDGDWYFFRKFFHGNRQIQAPKAVTHQYHLLIRRKRRHHLQQRLAVLMHWVNLLDLLPVNAGSGHVQRRHAVAGGLQPWLDLVPTPSSMASSVNQHEMPSLLPIYLHVFFVGACCWTMRKDQLSSLKTLNSRKVQIIVWLACSVPRYKTWSSWILERFPPQKAA